MELGNDYRKQILDFITNNYRNELIKILQSQAQNLVILDKIDICLGGSVGIAIYPSKWNKIQVLNWINVNEYNNYKIHYFGDKYLSDGNDYKLINHPHIIPHPVNTLEDTINILNNLYLEFSI